MQTENFTSDNNATTLEATTARRRALVRFGRDPVLLRRHPPILPSRDIIHQTNENGNSDAFGRMSAVERE
jgi:hypothetical protein